MAPTNARARDELRRVADEQAALRRVATLVARGEPPSAVFTAVAEEVGRVLPAVDVSLVGRYAPARAIEFVGGWSADGDTSFVGARVDLGGHNVATLVFETNRPARVDRLPDEAAPVTALAREWARSAAGAPIKVEGRLWGVVTVASSRPSGLATGIEHRLAGFTDLLATAIADAEVREKLRRIGDEQAALRRVATLVARGAPQAEVFAAVAEETGELFAAESTLLRYGPGPTTTPVGSWSPAGDTIAVGTPIPLGGHNVATLIFETGRPARIDRYRADDSSPVTTMVRRHGGRGAVGAPISVAGRLWGAVILTIPREEGVPADAEERLSDFAELVATAVANTQTQSELTSSRLRIVATADETRRRIERDLHDGAQQRLISLAIRLRAAQAMVPPDLGELAAELDGIAAGMNGALDELRELARGIHPAILAQGGLTPALKMLARRSAVPVELNVRTDTRLPETVAVAAYYVVSEALANAAKHAAASVASVDVQAIDRLLRVAVRDDGVGGADFAPGSGLIGLKDRVEALGGRIALESPRGAGTRLEVELPLTGDAAAASREAGSARGSGP